MITDPNRKTIEFAAGFIGRVEQHMQENREMKVRRRADMETARRIREAAMGKWKENPKKNVFTFRADDNLAEQILDEARGYHNTAEFLEEAVREKLVAERQRQMDEVVNAKLNQVLYGTKRENL